MMQPAVEVISGGIRSSLGRIALGQEPVASPSAVVPTETGPVILYTAASLAGAAIGGGIMGLIAASDWRGAGTGALFAAGMTGLADAFALGSARATMPAYIMGALGLGALSTSIWMAFKR